MTTKYNFYNVVLITALLASCIFSTVFAQITVGVKKGDNISYQVQCTGDVPQEHDVTNATIEVVNVREKIIHLKFTYVFLNGTEKYEYSILDLEKGKLGEAFIISANLTESDTFFEETYGNITISKIEERAYAGAKRTTVTATNLQNVWHWDQATGFLVEAKSTYSNFTITTIAKETNIWQPDPYELDPTVSILLVAAIIVALGVVVAFRVLKK